MGITPAHTALLITALSNVCSDTNTNHNGFAAAGGSPHDRHDEEIAIAYATTSALW
jgi:hypothetical protein